MDLNAREDSFFILRDCRDLFQRRLVEIAEQSGVSSKPLIEAYSRAIGEAHDELASSVEQDGFGQTAGLTASRISLVGHDDLELEIRIGEIISHLRGNDHIDHWRVQLRYMTLLNRDKMDAETNPVGLQPIGLGLWTLCKDSGHDLARNLQSLARIEELLQLRLPEVYVEINDLLEGYGVEPAQAWIAQRGTSAYPTAAAVDEYPPQGGQPSDNALAKLQQSLQHQFGNEDAGLAGFATCNASGTPTSGAGNVALNASALVMLNHLMERLRAIELQQATSLSYGAPEQAVEQPALRPLRAKDLDLPLGQPAAIALDTLALIFESIFSAPDLPDAVKAAIGRLQIPLLKVAMLDADFFADASHPARRLINRIARYAVGLDKDAGRDHVVCLRIGKLADTARTTLESADGQLSPCLDELDTLIAERDHALQAGIQPYRQLVLEHEACEAARSSAQGWLDRTLVKTPEPAIRQFLSDYWLRVMQSAAMNGGTASARWKESASCVEELLWSVQPIESADERRRLVALIPSLLKRINAGLDSLGVSAAERAPFLDSCFELQTAAMGNRRPELAAKAPQDSPAVASHPSPAIGAETPSVQILEQNGKLVQYLGRPTNASVSVPPGGSACKAGDWISFLLPDGERLCGFHGATVPHSPTVLLYNPDWGFAVALAPQTLEQQVRAGQARIASSDLLFDEAAERALANFALR